MPVSQLRPLLSIDSQKHMKATFATTPTTMEEAGFMRLSETVIRHSNADLFMSHPQAQSGTYPINAGSIIHLHHRSVAAILI